MKQRFAAAMLLLGLVAGCAAQPSFAPLPADRQLLVILDDDRATQPLPAGSRRIYRTAEPWGGSLHARAAARRLAAQHELRQLYAWPIPELAVFCVVFQIPDALDRRKLLERLNADSRVRRAQAVNEFRVMLTRAYDDPFFDVQYGKHRQTLETVHSVTTGAGVRIGIVDGPVDTAHVDLRGQISRHVPDHPDDAPATLRHGTAVAGVIAAAAGNGEGVVGLAPDATVSVYAGCSYSSDGVTRCTTVSLAEAIQQAVADASDVINLSLAGPYDWLLERLLRHAHERGAVLVAAHNGGDSRRGFPASLPFVHAAGAAAQPWFAPEAQFSTRAGGGYQVFVGSSMAAAGVAGMAALLRSQLSDEKASTVLSQLLRAGCINARDEPLAVFEADLRCAF